MAFSDFLAIGDAIHFFAVNQQFLEVGTILEDGLAFSVHRDGTLVTYTPFLFLLEAAEMAEEEQEQGLEIEPENQQEQEVDPHLEAYFENHEEQELDEGQEEEEELAMEEEVQAQGPFAEGFPAINFVDFPNFDQDQEQAVRLASSFDGRFQAVLLLRLNDLDQGRLLFFESFEVQNGIWVSEFRTEDEVRLQEGAGSENVQLHSTNYRDIENERCFVFQLISGEENAHFDQLHLEYRLYYQVDVNDPNYIRVFEI